jgi:hypothetical protein
MQKANSRVGALQLEAELKTGKAINGLQNLNCSQIPIINDGAKFVPEFN